MQTHNTGTKSILAYLSAIFFLTGCGTAQHLNDSSRSKLAPDVANITRARDIPYETAEKGGISVSYNLMYGKSNNQSGYRLTLIFRNNSGTKQVLNPVISLQDAGGFIIAPYAYEAFVAEAASLAGTAVPAMPVSAPSQSNYYHSGTIRNTTTGNTYSYSGTTMSAPAGGFAGGFAQGLSQSMAQGAAARAANDREEGRVMLRWANAFWLKSSYELPHGAASSGALFYPAVGTVQLPLRLNIEVGGQQFEFVTASGNEQPKWSSQIIEKKEQPPVAFSKSQEKLLEQRATLQPKTEPVNRYATLLHTKGPTRTIPPQTLSVEYADTGAGHGPARVIYPGNAILNGEYRTIGSGQIFTGQVKARLIDPDKLANFSNSSLRGFASFAGSDGTIMECVYAVTNANGNGQGSCLDNRGNQYELSF